MAATKFIYRARKMNGQAVTGELVAAGVEEANRQLSQLGLIPIAVSSVGSGPKLSDLSSIQKSFSLKNIKELFDVIPPKEVMMFTQQLQTVYAVGVPIVQGLQLIAVQTEHKKFREIIEDLIKSVSEGTSISRAMAKHPKVFGEIYVNMISVGEASGNLDEVLERLYDVIESEHNIRTKVASALFYPKMVLGMIVIVFVVVVTFVIPKLKSFYDSMGGAQLPLPTRMILGISDFFVSYFWLVAIVGAAAIYGFKKWRQSPKGGMIWDKLVLRSPVIGKLLTETEMTSFCIILEMLVRSGVGIVQSLEILKGTLRTRPIQEAVETCKKSVIAGGKIGDSLAQDKFFPKMLAGLVSVAEESGSLESVLSRTSRYYKAQVEYKVANLSKAIEPLLLAAVFGIVLLLALGILLPVWNMSSIMKK